MASFSVDDRKFELKNPRGRVGRKATNYLVAKMSGKAGDASISEMLAITVDEEFLGKHMKAFVSEDDAKFIDENATSAELLNMVMGVMSDVFEAFKTPEMDAALKNLEETQGAEASTLLPNGA